MYASTMGRIAFRLSTVLTDATAEYAMLPACLYDLDVMLPRAWFNFMRNMAATETTGRKARTTRATRQLLYCKNVKAGRDRKAIRTRT